MNVFGRDPKKETEFWMSHAKEVLDSDSVQNAVKEHKDKGNDGYTDQQREYLEFLKQMDQDKENKS